VQDAAVAAAAVLGLVDPSQTGIGGDAFALYYDASTRKVLALNGSGRSAVSATRQDVLHALKLEGASAEELKYAVIPPESGIAVTVPGAAAAWVDVVERFGSGKVGLKEVLSPAIELAEEGCGIGEISCHWWQDTEEKLRTKPNGIEVLRSDAKEPGRFRAPRVGEVYRNELLAKTMRLLAEKGMAGFYEGEIAEAIVEVVRAQGGYLTLEDLKHHGEVRSEMTQALPFRLEGELYASLPGNTTGQLDLWEHLPNGQGIVAQQALGLLQELERQGILPKFGPADHNSAR
jgi:gamma-glutamyltranspeptidase / glutathione hydrolase